MRSVIICIIIGYCWYTSKGFHISLTPTHGPYCTSQNLTMTCTINGYHGNKSDLASELTFTFNNEPVDPGLVTMVNSTTAECLITGKVPKKNFFYVNCCLNESCAQAQYPYENMIHSYVKPVPIQNLSCVVHDLFIGPINCSWVYGVDYSKSWTSPRVYFLWRMSKQSVWNTSKPLSLSTSYYYLDVDSHVPSVVNYPFAEVAVNVTTSECGYSEVIRNFYSVKIDKGPDKDWYWLRNFLIPALYPLLLVLILTILVSTNNIGFVRLPPISSLNGTSINSTCIRLTWDPSIYNSFAKTYSIHCIMIWDIPKYLNFTTTNQTEVTLCGLIPAISYNCTVRVKLVPTGWNESMWSTGQLVTVKTMDDVPGSSPNVTDGAYMWDGNGCTEGLTTGSVWIYWKPIAPIHQNGEMIGTVLTYNTSGAPLKVLANTSVSSAKLDLHCHLSHVVTLHAKNSRGLSREKSVLTIYPRQELVPELIVEESEPSNGSLYLEWSRPEGLLVRNYTVFHVARKPLGSCTSDFSSPIEWKIIHGNVNSTVVNLNDRTLHCFGISVRTEVGSSGIYWTDCVFGKQKDPQPPDDVSVTLGQTHSTLRVSWKKAACSPDQPYIEAYQAAYCPVSTDRQCESPLKTSSCPGTSSTLILDHIDADEYKVNVRAVTRFGVKSNWSVAVFQPTGNWSVSVIEQTNKNLTGGQIAAIVIASLVGIGLCVFVARVICRRLKEHIYELKQIGVIEVQTSRPSCIERYSVDLSVNAYGSSNSANNSERGQDNGSLPVARQEVQPGIEGQQSSTSIEGSPVINPRLPAGYVEVSMVPTNTRRLDTIHNSDNETSKHDAGMEMVGINLDNSIESDASSKDVGFDMGDRNDTTTSMHSASDWSMSKGNVPLSLDINQSIMDSKTFMAEENKANAKANNNCRQVFMDNESMNTSDNTETSSSALSGYVHASINNKAHEHILDAQAIPDVSSSMTVSYQQVLGTSAVKLGETATRFVQDLDDADKSQSSENHEDKELKIDLDHNELIVSIVINDDDMSGSVPNIGELREITLSDSHENSSIPIQSKKSSIMLDNNGYTGNVSEEQALLVQNQSIDKVKANTNEIQPKNTQSNVQMIDGYVDHTHEMLFQHTDQQIKVPPDCAYNESEGSFAQTNDSLSIVSGYIDNKSEKPSTHEHDSSNAALGYVNNESEDSFTYSNDCKKGYVSEEQSFLDQNQNVQKDVNEELKANRNAIQPNSTQSNVKMIDGYVDHTHEMLFHHTDRQIALPSEYNNNKSEKAFTYSDDSSSSALGYIDHTSYKPIDGSNVVQLSADNTEGSLTHAIDGSNMTHVRVNDSSDVLSAHTVCADNVSEESFTHVNSRSNAVTGYIDNTPENMLMHVKSNINHGYSNSDNASGKLYSNANDNSNIPPGYVGISYSVLTGSNESSIGDKKSDMKLKNESSDSDSEFEYAHNSLDKDIEKDNVIPENNNQTFNINDDQSETFSAHNGNNGTLFANGGYVRSIVPEYVESPSAVLVCENRNSSVDTKSEKSDSNSEFGYADNTGRLDEDFEIDNVVPEQYSLSFSKYQC